MARVLITGAADGLGRAAAETLLEQGHDVVVHARNDRRQAAVQDLRDGGAEAVVGDLSDLEETRGVAEQASRLGQMDAVIHNAGVLRGPQVLPVNTVAPYLLTALIVRPARLVYVSSGLHHRGRRTLANADWTGRTAGSYADSKLFLTAMTMAVARLWPDVYSNAVDPGWVPTKMGGPTATGDLQMGYLTQTWLAVSNEAAATVSGGYWYHRQRQPPAAQARDPAFQDQLMDRLAALTGVALF